MGKAKKKRKAWDGPFYAVRVENERAIFTRSSDYHSRLGRYPYARSGKFSTISEAVNFLKTPWTNIREPETASGKENRRPVLPVVPQGPATLENTDLKKKKAALPVSSRPPTRRKKRPPQLFPWPFPDPPRPKRPKEPRRQNTAYSIREAEIEDESGWEVVYTDGACQKNGMLDARAGLGVWWGRDDPRNLSERVPGPQTNNRAELIAIIRALETAPMSDRPLLIKTDSCYVISCVRDWLSIWKANNFRTSTGSEVKNWKVILYLQHLMDLRFVEARGAHIQHVKAHVGHEGNEGADVLAKKGVWERRVKERDWLSTVEIPESSQGHYQVQGDVSRSPEAALEEDSFVFEQLTDEQLAELERVRETLGIRDDEEYEDMTFVDEIGVNWTNLTQVVQTGSGTNARDDPTSSSESEMDISDGEDEEDEDEEDEDEDMDLSDGDSRTSSIPEIPLEAVYSAIGCTPNEVERILANVYRNREIEGDSRGRVVDDDLLDDNEYEGDDESFDEMNAEQWLQLTQVLTTGTFKFETEPPFPTMSVECLEVDDQALSDSSPDTSLLKTPDTSFECEDDFGLYGENDDRDWEKYEVNAEQWIQLTQVPAAGAVPSLMGPPSPVAISNAYADAEEQLLSDSSPDTSLLKTPDTSFECDDDFGLYGDIDDKDWERYDELYTPKTAPLLKHPSMDSDGEDLWNALPELNLQDLVNQPY